MLPRGTCRPYNPLLTYLCDILGCTSLPILETSFWGYVVAGGGRVHAEVTQYVTCFLIGLFGYSGISKLESRRRIPSYVYCTVLNDKRVSIGSLTPWRG
jgi:hypothetical protein